MAPHSNDQLLAELLRDLTDADRNAPTVPPRLAAKTERKEFLFVCTAEELGTNPPPERDAPLQSSPASPSPAER